MSSSPAAPELHQRSVASALRVVSALALTGAAAAVLVVSVLLTYGLAVEYGAGTPYGGGGWVLLVLGPAGVALLCLTGARRLARAPRPGTPLLAAGVLLVFTVAGAAAVVQGGGAGEREREAAQAASSARDVQLLASIEAPGHRTGPTGDAPTARSRT